MKTDVAYQLNLGGKLLDLSTPKVMAIINVTPDSFYSISRMLSEKEILTNVEKALQEGASIIDMGGYSTRPSAKQISEGEELERLKSPLKAIRKHFSETILSVDTFRSSIARYVVEEFGVQMINDVSGGTLDNEMFETVANLNVAYVLMHMRGTPETMQQLTDYENLMSDVLHFFEKRVAQLIHLGVKDILLDPGFGFAKTLDQNYELLSKISYLKELGFPILAGVSRKSMIYNLLETTPGNALNGTTVLNTLALLNGVNILRVHDVQEAMEAVKIVQKYLNQP
ncbi:Dihydropteroate synthase [uncultured Paludibacter sp.]|nr:Dihydropteroate synthase [uncultured Paludibacter sp.]